MRVTLNLVLTASLCTNMWACGAAVAEHGGVMAVDAAPLYRSIFGGLSSQQQANLLAVAGTFTLTRLAAITGKGGANPSATTLADVWARAKVRPQMSQDDFTAGFARLLATHGSANTSNDLAVKANILTLGLLAGARFPRAPATPSLGLVPAWGVKASPYGLGYDAMSKFLSDVADGKIQPCVGNSIRNLQDAARRGTGSKDAWSNTNIIHSTAKRAVANQLNIPDLSEHSQTPWPTHIAPSRPRSLTYYAPFEQEGVGRGYNVYDISYDGTLNTQGCFSNDPNIVQGANDAFGDVLKLAYVVDPNRPLMGGSWVPILPPEGEQ